MALIKCEDCGKEFSDKASACPNCGCPNDIKIESKLITKGNYANGVYEIYTDKIILKVKRDIMLGYWNDETITKYYKDINELAFNEPKGLRWGFITFRTISDLTDDIGRNWSINFPKSQRDDYKKIYDIILENYHKFK